MRKRIREESRRDYFYVYDVIYEHKRVKIYYNFKEHNKLVKGVWGMPRLSEAKKDVISCDKLRVLAHTN